METQKWLRCSLMLVAVQAVFVLSLAAASSRAIPFEFSRPMKAALAIWAAGLAFMFVRTGLSALKDGAPLASFRARLMGERNTLIQALQIAMIIGLAIALHGWAKSMIPHVTSYWADPMLADLDKAVFGEDPWRLFRSDLLAPLYSTFYVWWFPITFGTMGILAFSRRNHSRLIVAYLMTLIFGGTFGQYALPSAGPIFYEGLGFGPRFSELVRTNDPTFTSFAQYLWHHYEQGGANLGTGISAMPSMHIALAVWTTFAAYAIWRPLAIAAGAYALILWGASIASGWHYAVDGVIGAGVALASFRLSQLMLDYLNPDAAPRSSPASATG